MKEVMKIILFWNKLSALISSMISIVGDISERKTGGHDDMMQLCP